MMELNSSASALVGGTVTGRHLLHIEGYSHAKSLDVDERMESQPFSVGGRTWRIRYYPGGRLIGGVPLRDIVAFFVVLDDIIPEPAHAETRFLLLDRAGDEMPAHTQTLGMHTFFPSSEDGGSGIIINKSSVEAPECLAHDCFKIRVDVSVSTGFTTPPPPDLRVHLGALLVTKDGADVTFQVAGETFHAHRCILAARSPVFNAELFGARAAVASCIQIYDMVPQVFSALLHFVYTGSLPTTGQGEKEALMIHDLLQAADRYQMPRLKPICEEKLCRCLHTSTTATTLVLADQHHLHRLKKACIEFLKCPQVLNAVMATDGFQLILRRHPMLYEELIYTLTIIPPLLDT